MAVTIPRRRFPETLVFLSFLIPLMLLTPQSHAAVPAASSDYEMTTSIKVVINKGDTYDMTIVGQRKSRSSSVKEAMQDACDESEVSGILEGMKASYSERDGFPTCTFTSKSKNISKSHGLIKHKGDEYVLDTDAGGLPASSNDVEDAYTLSVTFPGEVTDADGGKVSGNTVTFTKPDEYRVSGKDAPAFPWVWVIVGVALVGAIGGGVFWFLSSRKKKAQQQAHAFGAMGYAPQQPYAPGQMQVPGAVPPPPLGLRRSGLRPARTERRDASGTGSASSRSRLPGRSPALHLGLSLCDDARIFATSDALRRVLQSSHPLNVKARPCATPPRGTLQPRVSSACSVLPPHSPWRW